MAYNDNLLKKKENPNLKEPKLPVPVTIFLWWQRIGNMSLQEETIFVREGHQNIN
jgi:hypothetical protein